MHRSVASCVQMGARHACSSHFETSRAGVRGCPLRTLCGAAMAEVNHTIQRLSASGCGSPARRVSRDGRSAGVAASMPPAGMNRCAIVSLTSPGEPRRKSSGFPVQDAAFTRRKVPSEGEARPYTHRSACAILVSYLDPNSASGMCPLQQSEQQAAE